MSIHQGYYAVIPANVRYSKDVSDGAKLLYGEITALCDKSGYCWASNAYFAGLYSASNRTVSRWISELARAEFIVTLADNAAANSRKIWIKDAVTHDKNVHTPTTKMSIPPRQKWRDPMDKNVQQNTTVNTTVNTLPIGSENAPENSPDVEAKPLPLNGGGAAARRANSSDEAESLIRTWANSDGKETVKNWIAETTFSEKVHGRVRDEITKFVGHYAVSEKPGVSHKMFADPVLFFKNRFKAWLVQAKELNRPAANGKPALEYQPSKYLPQP